MCLFCNFLLELDEFTSVKGFVGFIDKVRVRCRLRTRAQGTLTDTFWF